MPGVRTSNPIDSHRSSRKINLQSMPVQHHRADQYLVARNEGRPRSKPTAIARKVDEINVFLNALIGCEK
jgi:hypothetical protein